MPILIITHFALLCCFWSLPGEAALAEEASRAYAVELMGRLGGYRVDEAAAAELHGRAIRIHTSRTVLRTGPGGDGGPDTTVWKTSFWVDESTGRVIRGRIESRRGVRFEVKEAEFRDGLASWRVTTHEGEQAKKTIPMPDEARVPFSAAYPARILLGKGEDALRMKTFSMERGDLGFIEIARKGEEVLHFHGKPFPCKKFTVETDNRSRRYEVWITGEGELIKWDKPAEGIAYRPAKPEVAEKLTRKEAPPEDSISIGVLILNRNLLTYLCLEADINCPGINSAAELNFAGQTFEGTVAEGRITGTFRIRSMICEKDPALPVAATVEEKEQAAYLKPTPQIECASGEIRTAAEEAAKGLKNRWNTLHALGTWVRRNISLDPGAGGSALAALRARRSGAAGIARLHVALCRSLEIPARVVVGGLYRLTEKGASFSEHHWSEVHMGKAGWFPVDVAAQEVNYLDAGHIRLGEQGVFLPARIQIKDYIPKPEDARKPVEIAPRDFPLSKGVTHQYTYYLNDEPLGSERVALQRDETVEDERIFEFTSKHDFKDQQGKSFTRASADGRLLEYRFEAEEYSRRLLREGEAVHCEVVSEGRLKQKKAPLPREGLFLDSQQILHLAFMLSRLKLEPGQVIQVGAFDPASYQVRALQVEHKGADAIESMGREEKVVLYDVRQGFQHWKVYLTPAGRLVEQSEQGGMMKVQYKGTVKED